MDTNYNRLSELSGDGKPRSFEAFEHPVPAAGGVQKMLDSVEIERYARQHPGSVILAGLVTGGLLGWLTTKLSR